MELFIRPLASLARFGVVLPLLAGMLGAALAGCSSDGYDGFTGDTGTSGATGVAGGAGNAIPPGGADNGVSGSTGDPGMGVAGSGGETGAAGAGGSGTGPTNGSGSTFPPVADFGAPGPFQTSSGGEGPQCTLFKPEPLGAEGRRHPILLWGNGTFTSPTVYAAVLDHWASHGFIVAAANTSSAGSGAEMIACLDYVVNQYANVADTSRVGTSGHSQGGAGSIMAGRDPRVTATAPLQPYTQQGFGGFSQTSIGEQQGPMFLMSGSADTIAGPVPHQQRVYDGTNVPVLWGTLIGANHTGDATGNIGGYRGPATAWFRLHLMGDESARPIFYGPSCGLCADPVWDVQRKGID